MTDPLLEQDDAATPLSPEEREGLIPAYITLRGELNEAEQANILEAQDWAFSRKRDVLSEKLPPQQQEYRRRCLPHPHRTATTHR